MTKQTLIVLSNKKEGAINTYNSMTLRCIFQSESDSKGYILYISFISYSEKFSTTAIENRSMLNWGWVWEEWLFIKGVNRAFYICSIC